MGNKVKLQDGDWDILFGSGEAITIGRTVVPIKPLGIAKYGVIALMLGELTSDPVVVKFIKSIQGQPTANNNLSEVCQTIGDALASKIPAIIEICTGLDKDDVELLPPDIVTMLIEKIVAVNAKSYQDFVKNLVALGANLGATMQG